MNIIILASVRTLLNILDTVIPLNITIFTTQISLSAFYIFPVSILPAAFLSVPRFLYRPPKTHPEGPWRRES